MARQCQRQSQQQQEPVAAAPGLSVWPQRRATPLRRARLDRFRRVISHFLRLSARLPRHTTLAVGPSAEAWLTGRTSKTLITACRRGEESDGEVEGEVGIGWGTGK